MKRRDFLRALGILGGSLTIPPILTKKGFITPALAGISNRELRNARAIVKGEIDFSPPTTLPTVINIFMYGGPSELAGNLSNIDEINTKSQNPYNSNILTPFIDGTNNGEITANSFWRNAGGTEMEAMLSAGKMSVYRTINRVKDDTKAHRTSLFSAQTGSLNQDAPGVGTTLAAVLKTFMQDQFDNEQATPILPFVSFEGDTVYYNVGDLTDPIPLWLKPVSLDSKFANPYQRNQTAPLVNGSNIAMCTGTNGAQDQCNNLLDALAARVSVGYAEKYGKLINAFQKRKELDDYFNQDKLSAPDALVTDPAFVTNDGGFGATLKAAIVLALENTGTRFITLSTGGLGGWDDHDNSINKYQTRMQQLQQNLAAAVALLEQGTGTTTGVPRSDVVINVFGEFGRNVNLNGSLGWDHGNNMNLYTYGGSSIAGRAPLGQIHGTTKVIGTPGQNRLFTSPADGSPQWEPFSIASSIYKYFGVNNPEVLTSDDVMAPEGFKALEG